MKLFDINLPSNKKFGFFFTVIFLIITAYFFHLDSKIIASTMFVLALTFLIITLNRPKLLFPLNKLWMRFGLLLGMIINPIVMGIIFFGLITPYSIIMRIMGRDVLYLRKTNKSHWVSRSQSLPQTDFKQQF